MVNMCTLDKNRAPQKLVYLKRRGTHETWTKQLRPTILEQASEIYISLGTPVINDHNVTSMLAVNRRYINERSIPGLSN